MDTHSIIKQLTEQLSDSPVEQERISHLAPIEFVLLNLNKDVKIKVDEKHTFLCVPALEKSKGDVSYDDIEYLKITDEKLFELLQQYDQNNINEFIEYLNKEIFKYIQKEIRKAKDLEAWDSDNMWYEPNKRFVKWFQIKNIDPDSRVLKKDQTNNALWAIADDMRARKDDGEFDTYMDAYRWAEKNMSKKGINITAKKLEIAFHKARSEGKI